MGIIIFWFLIRDGHVTTETVYGQTLALRLGDGDEHCPLELDMTGLNVKGNLYLYLYLTVQNTASH